MSGNKKSPLLSKWAFSNLAERTGLEPATPGVTGRYSNQLNYRSRFTPLACERCSLTFSNLLLHRSNFQPNDADVLASPRGFEPLYSP
jgi:hypothetical protein